MDEGRIICFTCKVRAQCADYAERTKSTTGMWAGAIRKK